MVCHHLAKLGSHKYSSNRDMFLVCHMIKQDHIIKGGSDYKKPLEVCHCSAKSGGH